MCKLAIVILNWNGADMLRRYLPSVIKNSRVEGVKVVVADNGSTDDSIDVLRTCFPSVDLILLDQNYGFAGGYNNALKQIEAEYYLLLNSDVEIRQKNWIVPMLDYMDLHPETCACQPKLMKLFADNTSCDNLFEYAGAAGGYLDKYGYPFCRGRIFNTIEQDKGQYDDVVPIHWATGAALLVRSKSYWEVDGLDEKFFAHMEEIDLCWRMRLNGGKIVCITESTAYHLGGATLNQGNPRKTYLNFRNNLIMLYKNLPENRLRKVMPIRHILDFIASAKFLLSGDFGNMKAVIKATFAYRKMKKVYSKQKKGVQLNGDNLSSNYLKPYSILWHYYVKGNKVYSSLPED